MGLINKMIKSINISLQNYANTQYQNTGRIFNQHPNNLTRQDVINHPLYSAIPEHSQGTILPSQSYKFNKREVFSLAFSQVALKGWQQEQYRQQNKGNVNISHPSYRKILKQELSSVFQTGFQNYAHQAHTNVIYNALNSVNISDTNLENQQNKRHFKGTEIKSLLATTFASELWKNAQSQKLNNQISLHNPYEYDFNNLRINNDK